MAMRVVQRIVLIVLAASVLTGCGWPIAKDSSEDLDFPTPGPAPGALPVPPPYVAAALDATGGLPAWTLCTKLQFGAVVTAYELDGVSYLTEHGFLIGPWAGAIQISGREPRTELMCRIIEGQYNLLSGGGDRDVSPLRTRYRDYAGAMLQITTAPVRLFDEHVTLVRRPSPVMIDNEWYYVTEAKYGARTFVSRSMGRDKITVIEPYWTQGIYFQSQQNSLLDRVWLGNPTAQRYLIVRGYDYARITDDGVAVPTKVEIFESDGGGVQGRRLALIDLKR